MIPALYLRTRIRDLLAEHADGEMRIPLKPQLVDDLAELVVELCNETVQDVFAERQP